MRPLLSPASTSMKTVLYFMVKRIKWLLVVKQGDVFYKKEKELPR
jgi:hypothetical protein